ncbi:DUF6634 family protein [Cypionkella sp.]|uniref:DUF6634 family protein n=1 Tax=Cypionkella sp. TaxID=2811411 RepID=UPI002AB99D51|nr:DUF6634 family protein [Cypionkella sp.]MDZ4393322.1 DUF6634 family protein [Cypionkella sp.]
MLRLHFNPWPFLHFDDAREVLWEIDAGPDPAVLASAPVLDLWQPILSSKIEVRLTGKCSGHPTLGRSQRWIVTSPLLGLAPDYSWARTFSRFYRLGQLADVRGIDLPPEVRFPERCTALPLDQVHLLLDILSSEIRDADG